MRHFDHSLGKWTPWFWCTHYPLLRPIIQNAMGKEVKLIDSGAECARDISVLLNYFQINPTELKRIFSTDFTQQLVRRF